jgi:hypothetical protein
MEIGTIALILRIVSKEFYFLGSDLREKLIT